MYRFALRPWWIASHVLVLALVVLMVNLGLWQLRRLDEVRDRNARVAARLEEPAVPVEELVPPDGPEGGPSAVEHRWVTAEGTYRADEQVLVRGRSLDDQPGSWVLVPLELADGRVLAVNRGWIPNDGRFEEVPADHDVPAGEVEVTGLLQEPHERGSFGPRDPAEGRLTSLARVDLDRLDQQVEGDLLPVWLQMTAPEAGAPDPSPRPLQPPSTGDEGPHLSYAGQWFTFSTIALVGYPLILRKVARERQRRHPDDAPGMDEPDPDEVPGPGDPRLDPLP